MTYTSPILQIILAGWFLHNETKTYNSPTLYLVKELDYYARTEQWDKLLSAPLRSDKNAMHACFQNLALAQKVFWPTSIIAQTSRSRRFMDCMESFHHSFHLIK